MLTTFRIADCEALAVAVRFIESQGERVVSVIPVNDHFSLTCTGSVEVTNQTELGPFKHGVDARRTYWEEISEVPSAAKSLLDKMN